MAAVTPNMNLTKWNSTSDFFSHAQLAANWDAVDAHDHTAGKGPQIPLGGLAAGAVNSNALADDAVITSKILNSQVTTAKLATAAVTEAKLDTAIPSVLGINGAGIIRRGKSIIATEEARTNVAFGLLTTPDRVQNIVLPTDGLIVILYDAMIKSSGAATGSAAIFIGANQLKTDQGGTTSAVQAVNTAGTDSYRHISTFSGGLAASGGVWTGSVTTGQTVNNNTSASFGCAVFAAAGTYDVSVQFKATSGSVTAKERKLWVWTVGF